MNVRYKPSWLVYMFTGFLVAEVTLAIIGYQVWVWATIHLVLLVGIIFSEVGEHRRKVEMDKIRTKMIVDQATAEGFWKDLEK